ncbi:MAG: PQQ-dependent sugar dehydrogenase [Balneolaceae bacterium]
MANTAGAKPTPSRKAVSNFSGPGMNRAGRKPVSVLLLLLILSAGGWNSCTGKDQVSPEVGFPGIYLTHLQLESTTLVATELVNGLDVPWDITYGPDGWIWINEQRGTVSRVNTETGEHQVLLEIPDVHFERSRGLLSKAIHPDFDEHPYLFLHYVYSDEEGSHSRIVRYTFEQDTLVDRTMILDSLAGNNGHNGSRMIIGTDGKLWFGIGDAQNYDQAQNPETYHGKVLRMNLDGSVPGDNPFGNRVWSTGHRNIQGITSGHGRIYISEHGPDNDDEVNLILKGRNYGWPDVQGYCDSEVERNYCRDSLIVEPMQAFTPVIAPAGINFYNHNAIPEWKNSLLLTSLRIQTLRVLHLNESGDEINDIGIYFQQYFGRLRDLAIGPDGTVYLAASNTDWYKDARPEIHNPSLVEHGDRIIMLGPETEHLRERFAENENKTVLAENKVARYLGDTEISDDMAASEQLYLSHCASCHRPDGSGLDEYVPGLTDSEIAAGDSRHLIEVVLNGVTPENRETAGEYDWDMPAFRNLDDEEISALLTYIRSTFTDQTDQFSVEQVREVRSETSEYSTEID